MYQFDTDLYEVKAWDIRWHVYVYKEVWAYDEDDAMDVVELEYWYLDACDARLVCW